MVNKNEQVVVDRYVAWGWKVLRGGAPDFIMVKVNDEGEIVDDMAVEVKSEVDPLSYEQKVFRLFLERHGIKYKVEVVGNGTEGRA